MTFEELMKELKEYPEDLISDLEEAKVTIARLNPSNKGNLAEAKKLAAQAILGGERLGITNERVRQIVELF